MNYALYLNGVFETVLKEIIAAQANRPKMVCYLQPYSSSPIVKLSEKPPTTTSPIKIYISTTASLPVVTYQATIVGWDNKNDLEPNRLAQLNEHIIEHQRDEGEIYMTTGGGKPCVNLISIIGLQKLPTPIPVSSFIKISTNSPLKARSTSGGWSYIKPLPEWVGSIIQSVVTDELNIEHQIEVIKSLKLNKEELELRLKNAPKLPEQIQTISRGFRRNPDVAAAILIRANGICERCESAAPFIRASDTTPYLEVHHQVTLADGGEDTVENAIAICPNCHRELHFGIRQESQKEETR